MSGTKREILPPSLADLERLAAAALTTVPDELRRHVRNVVIRVEEFPDAETEEEMELESPFDIMGLASRGSLKLTRPTVFTHIADPEALRGMAADLFGKIESGAVKVRIDQRFRLEAAAEAHRALEARATTGSTVLLP